MKTRILFTAVLAALTIGLTKANENMNMPEKYQTDVQLTQKNRVVVRYLSKAGEKATVFVYNSRGERLSVRKIRNNKNAKLTYDLSNLDADVYLFTIVKQGEIICAEKVNIDTRGLADMPQSILNDSINMPGMDRILLTIKQ